MKLKTKAISILILLALVCLACGYFIMRMAVLPQFEALERRQATTNLTRARKAIERELFHLDKICRDWALWDDTYRFIKDRNQDYLDSNLVPGTFTDLHLSAIYFLDHDGRVVWGEMRDGAGKKLSPPDFAGERLPVKGLASILESRESRCGLMRATIGPMLFCASPITDSREKYPPAGILFMAQPFDRKTLEQINAQTILTFEAILLPPGSRGKGRTITTADERMIVSDTVNDYLGSPIIELRASFPRETSMIGRRTVRTVMLVSILTAIVLIVFSIRILDRLVISPLAAMSSADGADRGEMLAAISTAREDEIGMLAGKLAELEEKWERHAQNEASLSWDSGAREMAQGLLHNIRNAINPAFSDLSLMNEEMDDLPVSNMKKAAKEIAAAGENRRRMLALYLDRAAGIMESSLVRLKERVNSVRARCSDIEMMISAHAGAAGGARRISTFPLKTLVEAAVDIIPAEARERITFVLAPSLARRVSAPRIELLQVVQNLVKNAVEAITAVERGDGRITISAGEDGEEEEERVFWLKVEDNGCGIEPDDIKHIFSRDFSTAHARPGAGTGLHWCANVCRSLGGRIEAASPGPGKGACFTVILPRTDLSTGGTAPESEDRNG